MKVGWAADIHLDFLEQLDAARFCEQIVGSRVEALLLGGDIATAEDLPAWLEFLATHLSMPIYFVLGNHDYYGSDVHTVRSRLRQMSSPGLSWLPATGAVALTETVGLVGHGGWGDARNGDFAGSEVVLSDFILIRDLQESSGSTDPLAVFSHKPDLQRCLQKLGDEAAATLKPHLREAAGRFARVLVLTHVPPFPQASWYAGQISGDDWLPFMTCRAIGDLLLEEAARHPEVSFTVYCGHTHGSGRARVAPNLYAYTAGAKYGHPVHRVIDLDEAGP